MWKSAGRSRSGELNNIRIRCKFKYKSAIKEAGASAETALMTNSTTICVAKRMTQLTPVGDSGEVSNRQCEVMQTNNEASTVKQLSCS